MGRSVTVFENIKNTSTPFYKDVSVVFDRIREGRNEALVNSISECPNKDERSVLKKNLPVICFSGEFTKLSNESLTSHSGLICLDISNYKDKSALSRVKDVLKKDEFVHAVFVSASGLGLKIIVKIPRDIEGHRLYFNALVEWFDCDESDDTSGHESRACYESFDPDIFVNPDSKVWEAQKDFKARILSEDEIGKHVVVSEHGTIADMVVNEWLAETGVDESDLEKSVESIAKSLCNYGVLSDIALPIIYRLFEDFSSVISRNEIAKTVNFVYHNNKFNIKAFEDKGKINDIVEKLREGVSRKDIKNELIEDGIPVSRVESIVSSLEAEANKQVQRFWKKSEKGVVSLKHHLFRDFLVDNGFYKFYPEGSDNFIFIQKISNRVKNIADDIIKDFVLNYVDQRVIDRSVWDFFAENTKYFKEGFLSMLPCIEIDFIEDTPTESYLYYRNCAVKITSSSIELVEYENLRGWVWYDQLIDRDFKLLENNDCDFKTFVSRVSGDSKSRTGSIESTLGFLMHGYKDPFECPAIIINDEIISDGPEGGTGKGILMKSISHIKKMVTIDGKRFDFGRSFPYQTVQQDTQVLLFDDVKPKFEFISLFSVITEGITLEKKNKDAIQIPFSRSPKIAITTNYGIGGTTNSYKRRKWDIELVQHYRDGFTPRDEFHKRLFDDWTDQEWLAFDNYMVVNCLQKYLKVGLVKSGFKNLETRNFIANTCFDFYEWITQDYLEYNKPGIKHQASVVMREFISEYPDYDSGRRYSLKHSTFNNWMRAYGLFKYGTKCEEDRNRNGHRIMFVESDPIDTLFSNEP